MKIRLIALLAVVALSVMAVPASAAPGATDVGVFTGTAEVDPGLGLPVVTGGTGTWKLETTITSALHGTADLDASGDLGPTVGGLGAACGASSGTGTGTLGSDYDLTDLGWEAAVGGILPVVGTYDYLDGTETGSFVAIVAATGAAPCLDGTATDFTVVGAAALA